MLASHIKIIKLCNCLKIENFRYIRYFTPQASVKNNIDQMDSYNKRSKR